MQSQARRRILRDFTKLSSDPPEGICGTPLDGDLMHWDAVIFGPEGTIWEGGIFKLDIKFSEEYPNKAPDIKFITKVFHPNVYINGNICLDILQQQWSPVFDICAILTCIQSLLNDPNPNSPANAEAAQMYTENRLEYYEKVQQCVRASWEEAEDSSNEEDKAKVL
ncbi:ubiquitin-conjugating enzyme family protein [Cryptosporidium andersoni]|uniref:Ubiquitin-conjugating enzyme family protein n=1 Tax=Cryptosporidium andersoni TaxID=117008 RepID=A0A1J4MR64_9CRYT|nr:ubiquitin-conjugating enzyme family protein [Cryptosporidium andersoni]